jgi:hypothetical protein
VIRLIILSTLLTLATVFYVSVNEQQHQPHQFIIDAAAAAAAATTTTTTVLGVLTPNNNSDINNDTLERLYNDSQLATVCTKHGYNVRQAGGPSVVTYNMVVNDQLRTIYCTIGKAASSSWRKVILVAAGVIKVDNLDSLRYTSVRKKGLRYLRSLRHHKGKQISFYLDNYFKFMFVRHPFDRLVSAYRDKFRMQPDYFKKYGRKIIEQYRGANASAESLQTGNDVTFVEFIRFLVDGGTKDPDLHWSPQHSLCRPCEIKYDFIGHYETLWTDAKIVLTKLGVANNITFPQWLSNKTIVDSYQAMFASVPQQYVVQLRQIYAKDFELFGYE